MRRFFSVVVTFGLCAALSLSAAVGQELREQQQEESQISEEQTERLAALRTAAAQYEIVDVLLTEGRFAEVLPEFQVIANLGLRDDDQVLLTQAAWDFAVRLRDQSEFETAHKLIDAALEAVEIDEGRYSLLMMKGKIFKDQGRFREAIGALREAQQLDLPDSDPSPDGGANRLPQ